MKAFVRQGHRTVKIFVMVRVFYSMPWNSIIPCSALCLIGEGYVQCIKRRQTNIAHRVKMQQYLLVIFGYIVFLFFIGHVVL